MPLLPNIRFGTWVTVSAETVRVTASREGEPRFGSFRHYPRYRDMRSVLAGTVGDVWPGFPIGDDVAHKPGFDIEPDLSSMTVDAYVRMRRFPVSETGIVVGAVRRVEQQLVRVGDSTEVTGPTRELGLVEVVVQGPKKKSQLILVAPLDMRRRHVG